MRHKIIESVEQINFCPYCGHEYLETDVEKEILYCDRCNKEFTVMTDERR